jgi:mannan endo-1,4-beta-mannosidase
VDGKPFKFAGTNFYPAMVLAAGTPPEDSTRSVVEKTLDAMTPLGLTVMRCWAFNDGPNWQSLQSSPGTYSDHVLRFPLSLSAIVVDPDLRCDSHAK